MKKKNILLGALALILVAAVSVGGTLALLTASDNVVNTFTVGNVKIDLTEPNYKGDNQKLIPGTTIAKDPTVTVKANSEDCYVRVKVTVPDALANYVSLDYNTVDWTLDDDGYYRYNNLVPASDENNPLPAVFTKVTIDSDATGDQLAALTADDLKITVDAYAVQAASFADADAAWAAFDA